MDSSRNRDPIADWRLAISDWPEGKEATNRRVAQDGGINDSRVGR